MPDGNVLPFAEANRNIKARGAPHLWQEVAADFSGDVWPAFSPTFRFRPGEVIFTMGSCFARNIETHLAMLGCIVPMVEFELPASEWGGGVHGAMNRFHPPAFRQTLEWTARIYDRDGIVGWTDCECYAFPCGEDLYVDLDMGSAGLVSRDRFVERRQHIYDIFSRVFSAACLMMTPGFIEAWRDRETGLYIHAAPGQKAMLRCPERWELEVLAYDVCRDSMLGAIDCVRARNPSVKVLLTTSPVPLSATFTTQDVRVANMHSKSVLRAVCGEAVLARPMVDYFPSYESVMLSFPNGVWKSDRLHVSHGFIAKIVTRMLDSYLDGADAADRECQRARMHLLSGQIKESEACARAALDLRPGDVEARRFLAQALARGGRAAEAKRELEALLRSHPERPEIWLAFADVLARNGEAHDMVEPIRKALDLPGVALLDVLTVLERLPAGRQLPAVEQIGRRLIELFPMPSESYQCLIDVLLATDRPAEAREVLERAVGRRRATAKMHATLARLLYAEGRYDDARHHARIASKRDPDNVETAELLRALNAAGQGDGASPARDGVSE